MTERPLAEADVLHKSTPAFAASKDAASTLSTLLICHKRQHISGARPLSQMFHLCSCCQVQYHTRAAARDDEDGPVDLLLSLQMIVVMLSTVVHVVLNAISESIREQCKPIVLFSGCLHTLGLLWICW